MSSCRTPRILATRRNSAIVAEKDRHFSGHRERRQAEANGPIAKQLSRVCHDTLPWLISFSLGSYALYL